MFHRSAASRKSAGKSMLLNIRKEIVKRQGREFKVEPIQKADGFIACPICNSKFPPGTKKCSECQTLFETK